MKIYIKNMVCNRCKMVVQSTLERLGLSPVQVELGEVELMESDISAVKEQLVQEFRSLGFQLLDDIATGDPIVVVRIGAIGLGTDCSGG